jgi:hypothetical protein
MTTNEPPRPVPASPQRGSRPDHDLDLLALFALLALSTAVYFLVGPIGFSAVISAGGGLYATWRSKQ